MAQLPPDGEWLVQQHGGIVKLFHRHTEEVIVEARASDADAMARAQATIHKDPQLNVEQKSMAHFWFGYFYAHASVPERCNHG